jgi:hypothetical protein
MNDRHIASPCTTNDEFSKRTKIASNSLFTNNVQQNNSGRTVECDEHSVGSNTVANSSSGQFKRVMTSVKRADIDWSYAVMSGKAKKSDDVAVAFNLVSRFEGRFAES